MLISSSVALCFIFSYISLSMLPIEAWTRNKIENMLCNNRNTVAGYRI